MTIEFYLNDEFITLEALRGDETLLDYLRETKRLKGTKEGCGEGDCGACTVLIGRVRGGVLSYHSMNACIAFLPMMHRAHIVTIEALSNGGTLNWVQEAMVEFQGTQCGFCTPGIVMSLYAHWMNGVEVSSFEDWQKSLQGNLCRCTGYASILRAMMARQQDANRADDPLIAHRTDMQKKLEALGQEIVAIEGDAPFFIPQNLAELEAVSAMHPNGTIVAGATDVGLWVTKQFRNISPTIFIHQVEALHEIEVKDNEIRIGALVSFNDAEQVLADEFPTLQDYWPRIAGQQVRNMGTLGGSIANGSPIGDVAPILIALGAKLVLNHGGVRRELTAEDFFVDYGKQDRQPGEFLETMIVPRNQPMLKTFKVSKRLDDDISAVFMAINLDIHDSKIFGARIAYGGMAATPKRAKSAEAALNGQDWGEASFRNAMAVLDEDFTPMSDARASSQYRLKVAKNLLISSFYEWDVKEAAE